jgi:hypothetical protein
MFQFKNASSGSQAPFIPANNPVDIPPAKIRTFKEDLENFKKNKALDDPEENEISLAPEAAAKPVASEPPPLEQPIQKTAIFAPKKKPPVDNPFQSIPAPPPASALNFGGAPLNPPSQSFFPEKPAPLIENGNIPSDKKTSPSDKPRKSNGGLFFLLFLMVLAGGGYYYWFFVKSNTLSIFGYTIGKTIIPQSQPSQQATIPESKNQNLHRLVVDSLDNQGVSTALQKFTANFFSTTSENQLIEIKLLDKNNQPIGKKDFFPGFGAQISDSVLSKLSEEYSVFAKKEGDSVKLGLVFKTVTSSGLPEEMKKWEPTIISDLGKLYLDQVPNPSTATFSASRYKNADIRYFNLSSPAGTSLDYSVISNFLVIGTSKDTTRSILDYMSEK